VKKKVNSFWALSEQALFKLLNTNSNGLDTQEVSKRLQTQGENTLPQGKKISLLTRLAEQFADFLIILLLASAIIAFLLGERLDAIAILVIVLINAGIGFIQEYKAEQALSQLQSKEQETAKCYRDGKLQLVNIKKLVVGDVLLIEAGDQVPADCRLIKAYSLKADESSLTGESLPVNKNEKVLSQQTVLAEQHNMLFRGTAVLEGKATAVVVRIGKQTEIGKIAEALTVQDREETPLQKELDHIGKRLAVLIMIIALAVFALLLFKNSSLITALLTAIALAVAAIPEGLPAIVTIVLSIGVLRLARKKTIVRSLKAVETLGSVKYLLTDKTGTLTWNKINVVRFVDEKKQEYIVQGEGYQTKGSFTDTSNQPLTKASRESISQLLKTGVLCNTAELEFAGQEVSVIGDTTEGSLLVAAERYQMPYRKLRSEYEILSEEPFSSANKRMLVLVKNKKNQEHYIFAKGAPEVILKLCHNRDSYFAEKTDQWARQGWRNLGLAYLPLAAKDVANWQKKINQMHFLGMVAQEDTVRKEAIGAVAKAEKAGITTIMVTGDHRLAAYSIGRQVNIASSRQQVIDGSALENMEDELLLDRLLAEKMPVRVFSRVSPEQKLRIVNLIKKRTGAVVAVTGDGVNDAPSIKAANVGVAMGLSGSSVAKGAADLVIADDNYATLVTGIFQGRVIFDNLIKFVRYLLACNIGEVVVVFVGTMLGQLHILLPIQILFVNLATDSLPALALGFEKGTKGVLLRPPRRTQERILNPKRWRGIIIEGIFIGMVVLLAFYYFLPFGFSYARTVAFLVLVITQLLQALNSRDEKQTIFQIGVFSNYLLWLALFFSFALTYLATQLPVLRPVFRTELITDPFHWLVMIAISSTVLVFSGLRKKLSLW